MKRLPPAVAALGYAVMLAVMLAGCSAVQLAYDHADVWLRWRGERYFDVRGEQQAELDARIAQFMSWHREEALPRYAGQLHEAAQRLRDGLSHEDLVWGYDSVRAQIARDLQKAAAELAPILDTLEPDQIANLERRFADDNRKYAREFLSGTPEKRRARRARRNVERLEDWFGNLTDQQAERVRQHNEQQALIDEARDRERKRVQTELLAVIRAREARHKLAAWATQLVPGRGEPAYAAAARQYVESYFDLLVDIERIALPRQRERVLARLQGYADDLTQLSRARERAQARR